ncbi:hypothetical protein QVD17_19366 [Tagetes erecta]|uniref:Uncharacterized protein n=1 Tax=Tagetes erecta TaxID=13708 RepID=A0AAD8NX70_TARER|nr:hypothetical protein QVD17_19366 [Tagetes erecta]
MTGMGFAYVFVSKCTLVIGGSFTLSDSWRRAVYMDFGLVGDPSISLSMKFKADSFSESAITLGSSMYSFCLRTCRKEATETCCLISTSIGAFDEGIITMSSGSSASILNLEIPPSELWNSRCKYFVAENGETFKIDRISVPLHLQLFPTCTVKHKCLGSNAHRKDLLIEFDILYSYMTYDTEKEVSNPKKLQILGAQFPDFTWPPLFPWRLSKIILSKYLLHLAI